MNIGVDSNVIVAGVHANHPYHALAANWLVQNLAEHQLMAAHYSVLESYAVLTRLPGVPPCISLRSQGPIDRNGTGQYDHP